VLASGKPSLTRQQIARRMTAISMDEVIEETVAYYGPDEQDYTGLRCKTAGREIAAYVCRRCAPVSRSNGYPSGLASPIQIVHPT
jgi:hypothetical protein